MYNNIGSIILDVSVIVIIGFCAVLGYKRGFASTLVNILSCVASVIIANFLSIGIAKKIMIFTEPNILSYVQDKTKEIISSGTNATIGDVYNQLPYFLKSLVPFSDNSQIENAVDNSVNQISSVLTNDFIVPTIQMLLQSFLCIILFFILLFLFRFIGKRLNFINKIPIIGGVNAILGLILGLVQALVVIVILINIIYLIIAISKGNLSFINLQVINESILFKNIYDIIL